MEEGVGKGDKHFFLKMKKSQKIPYIGADGEQPEHLCAAGGSMNRDHSRTLAISTQAERRPPHAAIPSPGICVCV